jgi:hypothetical protein
MIKDNSTNDNKDQEKNSLINSNLEKFPNNKQIEKICISLSFIISALCCFDLSWTPSFFNNFLVMNKYYLSTIVVITINLLSIIINLFLNGCKKQIDFGFSSIRKDFSNLKEEKPDQINISPKIPISPIRSKRPSLVLFENQEKNSNCEDKRESYSSNYMESIMDKDEINEETSPKNFNSFLHNKQEDEEEEIREKKGDCFDKVAMGQDEIKEEEDKQYQQLENETKLVTNNNVSQIQSHRFVPMLNIERDAELKIEIVEKQKKSKFSPEKKEFTMKQKFELTDDKKTEWKHNDNTKLSLRLPDNVGEQPNNTRRSENDNFKKIQEYKIYISILLIQTCQGVLFLYIITILNYLFKFGTLNISVFFAIEFALLFLVIFAVNRKSSQSLSMSRIKQSLFLSIILGLCFSNALIIPRSFMPFLNNASDVVVALTILVTLISFTCFEIFYLLIARMSEKSNEKKKNKIVNFLMYFNPIIKSFAIFIFYFMVCFSLIKIENPAYNLCFSGIISICFIIVLILLNRLYL